MVNKSSPFDDPPSEKSIAEQWRREFSEELRAFAEPAVGRRLPKSLSDIKSEYDRLCKNHGGPAEIEGFGRVNFEWSCDKYRLGRFDHLLKRWQPDPATGVRHCTPIDHPGPRWSGYVHKLRKAGIVIETIREVHGGPFSGQHARYVLRTLITILEKKGGNS